MDLTSCPECGAPAEIAERHVIESTDGPVEHAKVRCSARHWFFLPVASLERRAAPAPTPATPAVQRSPAQLRARG